MLYLYQTRITIIALNKTNCKHMLEKISKSCVYLLIFLVPVFFLPTTAWPLAWNKYLLLAVLAGLAFIFLLIQIIKTGVFELKWTKLATAGFILFFTFCLY